MTITKLKQKVKVILSPLRLGSVTRIKCPPKCLNFSSLIPSIKITDIRNSSSQPIVRANRAFPVIKKCSLKRCGTCDYLATSPVVKSNVNNRNFSINSKINLS